MKEASKTREETCCFTGHRKIPEEEREQLARRLEATVEELIRAGVRYFVAGGALGFDTLAAQTILNIRGDVCTSGTDIWWIIVVSV